MRKCQTVAIAIFGVLCAAAPALAHHSFTAEFDGSKLIGVKGVLTKVDWENPHGWLYVDVKDASGNVANWAFETSSPTRLHHQYPDIRQQFISNVGKPITVVACPGKRVSNKGSSESVMFSDGTVLKLAVNYAGTEDETQFLQNVK